MITIYVSDIIAIVINAVYCICHSRYEYVYIYIQRTYAAGIYAHGCFQILIACSLLPGLCLVRSQLPLKSPRTDLFTPLVVPITASGLQGL